MTLLGLLLVGCRPGGVPAATECYSSAPDGPVAVLVGCRDALLGSDGRLGDFQLANPALTAVLRHPNAPVSVLGVSGATVADATFWGGEDHLLEAIPLVADGWMEITAFELLEDGLRVEGLVRDLPDRPSTDWGAFREVVWRVDPVLPVLRAEGADGMYVHAAGETERRSSTLASDDVAYGMEGTLVDLGSAIRASEPVLWVAPPTDPWSGRGVARVTGSSAAAEHIEVFADAERIARVPVLDGGFDFEVPPHATEARATATGHAPGPRVPVSDISVLEPGAYGSFVLSTVWDQGRSFPMTVRWDAADGSHELWLEGTGGVVPIGPDPVEMHITTRPDLVSHHFRAVPGEARVILMARAFDVGSRVLAAPLWPSARSRTLRVSNDDAMDAAAAAGLDWLVVTPEDAVGPPLSSPPLLVRSGVLISVDGLFVPSWPYPNRPGQPAWGAPDPRGLQPVDVLANLRGTENLVTSGFLEALGPPWGVDAPPAGVLLDRPEPDLRNLESWFAWLDAQVWIPPFGPRVWVEVANPAILGFADIEQGLHRGNSCATTGPLLTIDVDGVGSGESVPQGAPENQVTIGAHSARPLERLVLVGSGGELLAEWTQVSGEVQAITPPQSWWVAVGWSADDWMVTGPVLGVPTEVESPP